MRALGRQDARAGWLAAVAAGMCTLAVHVRAAPPPSAEGAEDPVDLPGHETKPNAELLPMGASVLYDPKADYDEGQFAAEEEIEAGRPTIWVLARKQMPPAKDPETGLPKKYIVVEPGEPWHEKCMQERIRGHNDFIRAALELEPGDADGETPKEEPREKGADQPPNSKEAGS